MKLKILVFLLFFSSQFSLFSQKAHWTSSGSYILSFSNAAIENPINSGNMVSISDAPRFTLWPNIDFFYHYNFHKNVGLYTGFGLNNLGLITKEKSSTVDPNGPNFNEYVKWKRRAYAISVPLALKIGKIEDGFSMFFGGQYDYMFHYKEKEFLSTGKRKMTEWFSNRVNKFIPNVFVGISIKDKYNFKISYGLDDFLNKDYVYTNTLGQTSKPYEKMNSRIVYVSFFINNTFDEITKADLKTKQIALL